MKIIGIGEVVWDCFPEGKSISRRKEWAVTSGTNFVKDVPVLP